MSSISSKLLYLILAVVCCSSSHYFVPVDCDQPVFVLETSDSSDSFQVQNEQTNKRDTNYSPPNTHIITDDNAPVSHQLSPSSKEVSQVIATEHHPSTTSTTTTTTHGPIAHSDSHHKNNKQQVSNQAAVAKDQQSATVRRLDELPAPNQRTTNNRSALPQARPRSTTTTSPYLNPDQQPSAPKTEERLLISITSEEDEYRPPQRQVIASTGGFDEVPTTSQSLSQQQQQSQKKKPAITISIQDNSNKQGGSGAPSVILRPSENGQSIIISTLGSSAIEASSNSNNNKYNPNKPAIAIVASNGHGSTNNNNEPPYREPVEPPPVQGSGNQYPTHRPPSNEYGQPANKPIVSTLVEQPRPPVNQITQRPPINEDYEQPPSRPSTPAPNYSRPSTHTPSPFDYSNGNNNGPGADVQALTGSSSSNNALGSKYPLNEKNCGVIHETRIVGGDEADPNDFLWMAAIIKSRPTDGEVKPFCGGSLITRRHILTAAHCLDNLAPRDVLVRLGSYDFDDSTASSLSSDYAIDQFRKPAQYNKKTHVADIAIMRLKTPLQMNDNYRTVCMPQARRSYVGALGTVTGYGSQSQTFRRAAPKLRQVTVPIWENRKCSAVYKKNLTESFLCAGYDEGGKDACQGDSGGPLMTEGPNERTIVVGVVSHGIGCGSPGYPGVYTRISTFLDWIEENTRE